MDWPLSLSFCRQAGRSHIVAQGMQCLRTYMLRNSIVSADGRLCVRVALCAYRIHRRVCVDRKKPAIVNMISMLLTRMFNTALLCFFLFSDGLQPPSSDTACLSETVHCFGWRNRRTHFPTWTPAVSLTLATWLVDGRRLKRIINLDDEEQLSKYDCLLANLWCWNTAHWLIYVLCMYYIYFHHLYTN